MKYRNVLKTGDIPLVALRNEDHPLSKRTPGHLIHPCSSLAHYLSARHSLPPGLAQIWVSEHMDLLLALSDLTLSCAREAGAGGGQGRERSAFLFCPTSHRAQICFDTLRQRKRRNLAGACLCRGRGDGGVGGGEGAQRGGS